MLILGAQEDIQGIDDRYYAKANNFDSDIII